jgi:hypothetical protein
MHLEHKLSSDSHCYHLLMPLPLCLVIQHGPPSSLTRDFQRDLIVLRQGISSRAAEQIFQFLRRSNFMEFSSVFSL